MLINSKSSLDLSSGFNPGVSDRNVTKLLSNQIQAAKKIPGPFPSCQLQSFLFFDCQIFSVCISIIQQLFHLLNLGKMHNGSLKICAVVM